MQTAAIIQKKQKTSVHRDSLYTEIFVAHSVNAHRRRQNVLIKNINVAHGHTDECVTAHGSYHILTSPVIYY